jgi:hypothetical protein
MTTRRTIDEKKQEFNVKWQGKIDDKFIDYNLPIKSNQKFICLKNDKDHIYSDYFNEDEKYVIFTSSLSLLERNKNEICPVCIKQWRSREAYNKLSHDSIVKKINDHPNNIIGKTGNKTILISQYVDMQKNHDFLCNCGNKFNRRMTDILRIDRSPFCSECLNKKYKDLMQTKRNIKEKILEEKIKNDIRINEQVSLPNLDEMNYMFDQILNMKILSEINDRYDIFRLTLEEAQERINQRFGEEMIEIIDTKIINVKSITNFYCFKCKNTFKKVLQDLLVSNGCPHCKPYGYSKKCIRWLKTFSNYKDIQNAENGGEYIFPGTRWRLDGIDHKLKIIYEFHGCDFHGHCIISKCKKCTNENGIGPYGVSYEKEYIKTLEKKNYFLSLGYQYVEMWECEFIE